MNMLHGREKENEDCGSPDFIDLNKPGMTFIFWLSVGSRVVDEFLLSKNPSRNQKVIVAGYVELEVPSSSDLILN